MKQLICLAFILLALGACGKRASVMEPAEDVNPTAFPRSYPDPATDPAGTYSHEKPAE